MARSGFSNSDSSRNCQTDFCMQRLSYRLQRLPLKHLCCCREQALQTKYQAGTGERRTSTCSRRTWNTFIFKDKWDLEIPRIQITSLTYDRTAMKHSHRCSRLCSYCLKLFLYAVKSLVWQAIITLGWIFSSQNIACELQRMILL